MIDEWIELGYSKQEAEELHEFSKSISMHSVLSIDEATCCVMQLLNNMTELNKMEQDRVLHNAIKNYIKE